MRRIIEVLATTALVTGVLVAGVLVQAGSVPALAGLSGGDLNCTNPAPQPILLEPQLPVPGYPVTLAPPCVLCRAPSQPGCWMEAQDRE